MSGGSCSPPSTPQCPPLPLPGMAMDPDAPEWLWHGHPGCLIQQSRDVKGCFIYP